MVSVRLGLKVELEAGFEHVEIPVPGTAAGVTVDIVEADLRMVMKIPIDARRDRPQDPSLDGAILQV
jgi:hypothetical protein